MAWIRLDDDYVNHPKFTCLSDRAFRLWHEGMCYCRKLMTDGLIPRLAVRAFRYATPATIRELLRPPSPGGAALWADDHGDYRVHDYLDWNPSREEDQHGREAAKLRMRAYRGKAKSPPVTPFVTPPVTGDVTPSVPGEGQGSGSSLEKRSGEKPLKPALSLESDEVAERAGRLLRLYAVLYQKYRHGAKLRLVGNSLEFQDACSLVTVWDDARLEKLAILVLDTDDPFISKTDRSFKIFALKASWADDKLKAWELENGVAV